jgi:hypothetical protein
MYLSEAEREAVLSTLWESLTPGGRLICIEPAAELAELQARLPGRRPAADATSGVRRFRLAELSGSLRRLPGAALRSASSIRLVPGLAASALHHCVSAERGYGS